MHVVITEPVYSTTVHLFLDATTEDILKTFRKVAPKSKESAEYVGVGCTWEFGPGDGAENNTFAVAIRSRKMDSYGISVLVHEMLHVTHQVMENVGLGKMDHKTVEAFAYFQDMLVREALCAIL